MSSHDPDERRLVARLAAHRSWANTSNPTARTQAARDAFLARFDDEVDPDRRLTVEDRARRASHARRAYFASMSLRAARSRKARRESGAGPALTAGPDRTQDANHAQAGE